MSKEATRFVTFSGYLVDLVNPDTSSLDIEDVIFGSLHRYRYGGHIYPPANLLQHIYFVSKALYQKYKDPELAQAGFLHDAGESYLSDIPCYIKPAVSINGVLYETVETNLTEAVFDAYLVNRHLLYDKRLVKMDMLARVFEKSRSITGHFEPMSANTPDADLLPLFLEIYSLGVDEKLRIHTQSYWDQLQTERRCVNAL